MLSVLRALPQTHGIYSIVAKDKWQAPGRYRSTV